MKAKIEKKRSMRKKTPGEIKAEEKRKRKDERRAVVRRVKKHLAGQAPSNPEHEMPHIEPSQTNTPNTQPFY